MAGLTGVLVAYARTVHDVELEKDPLAKVAPAFVIGGTADAILAYVDGRARVAKDELVQSIATLWLITGNGAAQVGAVPTAVRKDMNESPTVANPCAVAHQHQPHAVQDPFWGR